MWEREREKRDRAGREGGSDREREKEGESRSCLARGSWNLVLVLRPGSAQGLRKVWRKVWGKHDSCEYVDSRFYIGGHVICGVL
jgi:hypothetical protein